MPSVATSAGRRVAADFSYGIFFFKFWSFFSSWFRVRFPFFCCVCNCSNGSSFWLRVSIQNSMTTVIRSCSFIHLKKVDLSLSSITDFSYYPFMVKCFPLSSIIVAFPYFSLAEARTNSCKVFCYFPPQPLPRLSFALAEASFSAFPPFPAQVIYPESLNSDFHLRGFHYVQSIEFHPKPRSVAFRSLAIDERATEGIAMANRVSGAGDRVGFGLRILIGRCCSQTRTPRPPDLSTYEVLRSRTESYCRC